MSGFDVFLSHASEDKETLVRPLADRLINLGLVVAYDEYTFRLGDSLVESIDRGISRSSAGVIVLSEAFFVKPWPTHEKNGLVSRMVTDDEYVLIPVWHGVSREQVAEFSATLADRIALTTAGRDLETLALEITQRVRPDLFTAIARRAEFDHLRATGTTEMRRASELEPGPIRHDSLPTGLSNRIRVVSAVFSSVSRLSLDSALDNFRRDLYPDIEVRVWERMAACYLETCEMMPFDDPRRQAVYEAVLAASFSAELGAEQIAALDPDTRERLIGAISYQAPWESQ